jgi:hypothetical protein
MATARKSKAQPSIVDLPLWWPTEAIGLQVLNAISPRWFPMLHGAGSTNPT